MHLLFKTGYALRLAIIAIVYPLLHAKIIIENTVLRCYAPCILSIASVAMPTGMKLRLHEKPFIVLYVLDNMPPPPFLHYFVPKVGRGLILEYAVSIDYTPPQPFLLHTVQGLVSTYAVSYTHLTLPTIYSV